MGEKELLLELVHVRFFGRREFVYKRVKETKGGRRIRGGRVVLVGRPVSHGSQYLDLHSPAPLSW